MDIRRQENIKNIYTNKYIDYLHTRIGNLPKLVNSPIPNNLHTNKQEYWV